MKSQGYLKRQSKENLNNILNACVYQYLALQRTCGVNIVPDPLRSRFIGSYQSFALGNPAAPRCSADQAPKRPGRQIRNPGRVRKCGSPEVLARRGQLFNPLALVIGIGVTFDATLLTACKLCQPLPPRNVHVDPALRAMTNPPKADIIKEYSTKKVLTSPEFFGSA